MKHVAFLTFLMIFFVSCGGDVGRRDGANRTPLTPSATAEENHNVASQLMRTRGTTTLSSLEEISNIIKGTLSNNFRTIPQIAIDDEGSLNNVITTQQAGRPSVECGKNISLAGIDNRITECARLNGGTASWDGSNYGHAGEALWKLVHQTSAMEIWLDTRTGLVWSDVVTSTGNWCAASGNTQDLTSGSSVDCDSEGKNLKLCQNLVIEGMGLNVTWRLPTRNDFLQAELDGLRFVVKSSSALFWTATVDSKTDDRTKSWLFNSSTGNIQNDLMTSEHSVRCVGAPVR